MTRSLAILVAAFVALACLAPSASAGRLSDLPWDDKIPQDIRSGVRYAIEDEIGELTKKTNEQGKKFVRAHRSEAVEPQPDGKVVTYVTVQRCLADKMVTERWRYTLEKNGKDYKIVGRDKIAESDDAALVRYEAPDKARPLTPFTFVHDLLQLKMDSGAYTVSFVGAKPDHLLIAGAGRVTIKPLDDYETMFYQRRLGRKDIDTAVSEVQISFHADDPQFLQLVGYGKAEPAPVGDSRVSSGLRDLYDDATRVIKGKEFTPYSYQFPERPEPKGRFTLRMKTADHGWINYDYDPTAVKEISITGERSALSLSKETSKEFPPGISHYYAPQTRALPLAQRESRRGLQPVELVRADGRFDIASDKFSAVVTADMNLLLDSRDGYFYLAGNPTVRSVKLNGSQDLMFVPFPSLGSKIYGFEETSNIFRVFFPQEMKAGTSIRLTVSYDSPKLVRKISEAFWYIDREGFLPIVTADILAEQTYMHFVIRSKKAYQHVSIGSLMNEEEDDEYRYSEWGADSGFNFPTLIIGKYFPPVRKEYDGIKYSGYMTREFLKDNALPPGVDASQAQFFLNEMPTPRPSDMEPQVLQAAQAVRNYAKWFNWPYPFKELKLVGTPAQFLSAQSPSSIVYIGEAIFWPDRALAELFRGLDPTWTHNVTAHEVAHQWFGGAVSNISMLHYWFVETFAELSSAFYAENRKDDNALRGTVAYWRNAAFGQDWRCALMDDTDLVRMEPGIGPTMMRYTKGPYVFWMLKEYYGEQKLIQFLRNMITLHGGDLMSTADIQDLATRTFGENMDWFFDEYIRGVGIPEVRYRFDAARPAEDGKGWIITGKLSQQIMVKGDPVAGKVFKHLLVLISVPTEKGPEKVKEFLDASEKDIRIRVESKPNGAPKVNDQNAMYMTVKEM